MLKQNYTELKERHAELEQGRNYLKEGVKILKKAIKDQKALERENKQKESAMRVTLKNQLDALKIECQMLRQNDSSSSQNLNGEVQRLEERILEGEKEINLLKELIEKEKLRADAEKKRADAEKKRAECEGENVNDALTKVKEDKKLTNLERKNNEENKVQLEALKTELAQVKLNLEQTGKQLEIERLRADSEQKRAESEKNKADEALKKVKENKKDVNDDSKSSEEYRVQLEVLKAEIVKVKSNFEDTKKQLDLEKTSSDAEKKIAESMRKKANEAEKKVKEDARLADVERKKSEESRVQLDVLMAEKFQLRTGLEEIKIQLEKEKIMANAEKKRADADNKISESERKKTNEAENKTKEATRLADVERKKSEESRVQLEALKNEFIQVKLVLEETKKQLEKEKTRADAEKKRAESERKKGSDAVKKIKEDNRLSDVKKWKSKESKSQLEVLKTGTVGVKENSEENKSQQVNGSRKSSKRKKCGELAVIKEYDQSKVAEIYWKKAKDEKCRADTLTLQLEKERERNLELEREISELVTFEKADQQTSGNANKQPTKEKHLVEQLYQEVDNNKHRIQEMQSLIENLLCSKNLLTSPVSIKNSEPESAKIKSLRKKVKFEKMMVKHAKQVAELEVGRNNILQYELCRLKQEILKFSEHLDILDNPAFKSDAGIAGQGKLCSLPVKRKHSHERPHPRNLCFSREPTRLCSTCNAAYSKYSVKCSAPFLPLHEGCSGETISGINSQLECLHRGCNHKMLQSSAIYSCSTSFSDRPLVGSQEDGVFPITTEKNNRDDNRNKESHGTVEAIVNLTSEGRTTCQPHKLSDRSFPENGSLIPVLHGNLCNEDIRSPKRRKEISEEHMVRAGALGPSAMESDLCKQALESRSSPPASIEIWKNGINGLLSNPELSGSCNGLDASNIMRLFDLDNEQDERSFSAAMERPLSPSLPVLELKNHNTADAVDLRILWTTIFI